MAPCTGNKREKASPSAASFIRLLIGLSSRAHILFRAPKNPCRKAEALTTLFLHRRYRLRGKYMGEVGELQAATVSCYFPVGAGRPAHGGSRTREMYTHTHKSHVYLHAQGQTQVNTHIHIQTQGTQNRIHTA